MKQNELFKIPSIFDIDNYDNFPRYDSLLPRFLFGGYQLENRHTMKCDLKELDNAYILEADIPGADKDDITVNFDSDKSMLTVAYEHKNENETNKEDDGYVIKERSYVKTSRSFVLPSGNRDNIHAKYDNGVLTVTVEKKEEPEKEEKQTITIE